MVDETNYIIQIWNHLSFTPSQYYNIIWSLKEDDTVIQSGIIDCPIEPLRKKQVKLPIVMPTIKAGAEYRIELTTCIRGNELWAKKGHLVAWEQLELSWHKIEMLVVEPCKGKLTTDNTDSITVVSGNNFSYTFSRKEGKSISMVVNGEEMLIEAPLMNVWRAPLANGLDDWIVWSENRNEWKEECDMRTVIEQYSTGMDNLVNIAADYDTQISEYQVNVNIYSYMLIGDNAVKQRDKHTSGIQTNGFENFFQFSIRADGSIRLKHIV